jgi:hypothetical protein
VVLVVAGLVIGIVLLLAIPLDVAFRLERVEAFTGRLVIRWLFGLVRVRIQLPHARERSEGPASGTKPAEPRPRRRARPGPGRFLAVLRQAAFRERVRRLAGDLVGALHPTQLSLRMRLGLGDPADTGFLWAVVGPLNAVAQGLRRVEVWIEPEFVDPVLEFRAHGRVLLVPLQLLALAICFALSPESIRAWRTLRAGLA